MFAVKFDGRHKARLVAAGHLTPEPIDNIYFGVVSLRNLRLVILLGKLNHLDLWGADIGNAYLEAFTDETLYIVAGNLPSEAPTRDPYMSIDTPSDEFCTINTNQSGPPMSTRHKLQPRLLRPYQSPNTYPKKQTKQK